MSWASYLCLRCFCNTWLMPYALWNMSRDTKFLFIQRVEMWVKAFDYSEGQTFRIWLCNILGLESSRWWRRKRCDAVQRNMKTNRTSSMINMKVILDETLHHTLASKKEWTLIFCWCVLQWNGGRCGHIFKQAVAVVAEKIRTAQHPLHNTTRKTIKVWVCILP